MAEVSHTADLAQGWFANLYTDGTMTVRNCDKGQRIDLSAESVALLRKIIEETSFNPGQEVIMGRMIEFVEEGDNVWRWRSVGTPPRSFSRAFDSRTEARENACFHLGD